MLNRLTEKQIKIIQYAGMFVLLGFFFWKTRYAIFGVQEEYGLFYIVQKGDFLLWMHNISRDAGRITYYVSNWFWAPPMFFSNPMVYKIFLCLLTTIDVIVFYHLLSVHVNKKFAAFAITFILITFQISSQHNLLISYSFLHVPFILLMISTHLLLNYCKGIMGEKAIIWSAVCSCLASFFQENFVLFYVFSFVIIFFYVDCNNFGKRVLLSLWKLKYHVLGGVIFLVSYFGFRLIYGTNDYAGNAICLNDPMTSLKALVLFITGMIPGRTFKVLAGTVGLKEIVAFISKKDLLFIVAGTVFLCFMLYRTERFKKPRYLIQALLLCCVLACVLHSVSQQYVDWVSMGTAYAYVPSYFCSFFLNTIICLVIQNIYSRLKGNGKRILMIIFALCSFCLFSMSVATNNFYNTELHVKFEHYEDYRTYFQSGALNEYEDYAQVLIVDNYPVEPVDIKQCMTTVRYDAFFFTVTNDKDKLDKNKNYYILEYKDGGLSTTKIEAKQ